MDPEARDQGRCGDVPGPVWEALARKRIYFGHQSVGANILDGIREIMGRRAADGLVILETEDAADLDRPALAHSTIGRNGDPGSKIDHFRAILEGGVGRVADVAMFKFCFVDIDRSTDIGALFEHYARTITALGKDFPRLRIVPWTVPLTGPAPGLRPALRRLLGRGPSAADENRDRAAFNARIRREFGGLVYDLAGAEAAPRKRQGGPSAAGGGDGPVLDPGYSSDGGHLNERGRRVIAIDLLNYLAGL
jgi:hypothetical protein